MARLVPWWRNLWRQGHAYLQLMRHGRLPYLGIMLGIGAAGLFLALLLELIEEVWWEQSIEFLDAQVFHGLQAIHRPRLDQMFIFITRLGNPASLIAVVVTTSLLLLLARRRLEALVLCGGFVLSGLSITWLKFFFGRERPVPDVRLVLENSPAFPSGHSTLSVVIYLFVAYLFARQLPGRNKGTMAILTALAFTLGIGFSRLYLGVHWLSDVLAGYAVGGLWLSLLVTVVEFRLLLHRQQELAPAQQQRLRYGRLLGIPLLLLFLLSYALGG